MARQHKPVGQLDVVTVLVTIIHDKPDATAGAAALAELRLQRVVPLAIRSDGIPLVQLSAFLRLGSF
jgi:hypothetical protein